MLCLETGAREPEYFVIVQLGRAKSILHKVKTNALVFSSDITLPAGQSHIASQKIEYRDPDDTSDLDPPQPDRYNGISKSGFLTFGHLPAEAHCFDPDMMSELEVDIAILGAPFDTGISYKPGSRFGPDAIRQGTRKYSAVFSPYKEGFNPWNSWAKIVDCGNVTMTPVDNRVALDQLTGRKGHS
ncbi:hypothetical protein KL927_004296 [Ogataea polymorpha]|nr:hypothetical protein KL927_004296 [Ogataea polymorpha]